jgi:hypothetical protein
MDVGGGPDNAGGRGLVSGGGPNPNPRAAPTFMAERFCVRGRIGRPLPASAIVGSLDGCTESYSSSLRILRLRDVTGGRDEENEAGILGGSSRSRSWASRVAFRRVSHVIAILTPRIRRRRPAVYIYHCRLFPLSHLLALAGVSLSLRVSGLAPTGMLCLSAVPLPSFSHTRGDHFVVCIHVPLSFCTSLCLLLPQVTPVAFPTLSSGVPHFNGFRAGVDNARATRSYSRKQRKET